MEIIKEDLKKTWNNPLLLRLQVHTDSHKQRSGFQCSLSVKKVFVIDPVGWSMIQDSRQSQLDTGRNKTFLNGEGTNVVSCDGPLSVVLSVGCRFPAGWG